MLISFIAFCICGRSLPSQEDGQKSGITLNGLQIYNQYGRCRGLSYHGGILPARSLSAETPSAAVFCRISISFFRIVSLRLVAILIAGMLIVFCVLGSQTSGADYLLYKEQLLLSIPLLPQRISLFIRQTA
ncbi:hypothetical protein [Sutterella wadsworthensis]|uniref:hypothetical protein n=1 Tax=Sutterella wadsworthensis TaxID=40545 RepID=UPI003976C6B2